MDDKILLSVDRGLIHLDNRYMGINVHMKWDPSIFKPFSVVNDLHEAS